MRPDDNLKSLVKIGRLLDCFSTLRRSLSLTELCELTGYPKSTTHRLISSMKEIGFLDQDGERDRYRLGIKLFELGNMVLSNMELHREARPFVDALSRISGQLVHLAVFDGRQAVVIHRSDPCSEAGTPLTLVENAPVHCTSVGKAILAFQPQLIIDRVAADGLKRFTPNTVTDPGKLARELEAVRARGYAVDEGEHQPGLRCIGAPVRDRTGCVVAGLSVSGPSWKIPAAEVTAMSEIVIHHAAGLSAKLGHVEPEVESGSGLPRLIRR
jgi:IclR family transcriptional regulator, KDG regulon repressor